MKKRYRLYQRGKKFYCHDGQTNKQHSLRTTNRDEAERLVHAYEEAHRQPAINLQIARAYLIAADPTFATRTWLDVLHAIADTKKGDTNRRWKIVGKDQALAPLWKQTVTQTNATLFLSVMRNGTVSTNIFLRRIHNFARDPA